MEGGCWRGGLWDLGDSRPLGFGCRLKADVQADWAAAGSLIPEPSIARTADRGSARNDRNPRNTSRTSEPNALMTIKSGKYFLWAVKASSCGGSDWTSCYRREAAHSVANGPTRALMETRHPSSADAHRTEAAASTNTWNGHCCQR